MQMIRRLPRPHHGRAGPRSRRRATTVVLVAMLVAVFSGCIEGPEWIFYATNESAERVIINSDVGSTVVLPPHSYTVLGGGKGAATGGWRIEIVDASCNPRSVVTIADGDQYVIVDADGHLSRAAIHSVVGQTQVSPATEAPPQTCPRPRERPAGG